MVILDFPGELLGEQLPLLIEKAQLFCKLLCSGDRELRLVNQDASGLFREQGFVLIWPSGAS